MVRRYSHTAEDPQAQAFHENTSKAVTTLHRASDALGRQNGDDLTTTTRKRKQRVLLEQAMMAIKEAQKLGIAAEEAEQPVLTKYTLKDAVKRLDTLGKVADHFGVQPPVVSRMMKMFNVQPADKGQFYGGSR